MASLGCTAKSSGRAHKNDKGPERIRAGEVPGGGKWVCRIYENPQKSGAQDLAKNQEFEKVTNQVQERDLGLKLSWGGSSGPDLHF